jgi:thiamine biosynthesis protein ThiI
MAQEFVSITLSGDIGTKAGPTRGFFHRRLHANIKATLARHGFEGRIRDRRDRIDIEGVDDSAVAPLSRMFGVRAVRSVQSMAWQTIDDIVAAGERLYGEMVAGRRFAVRPRRVGSRNNIGISSEALARQLGARLVAAGGRVDLDRPDVRLRVEVRPGDVLFFHEKVPGPGGLPIGVEGRALALISGGFDSAVAAWEMMRRGVELDFVLLNFAGPPQEDAVRRIMHRLDARWMAGAEPRLFVIDFRPVIAELRERVHSRDWQVVLKRLMMRAADRLADDCGAEALITGEALGQVSSQTLTNLGSITAGIDAPVLRPLVGRDKDELIARARHIGTADISGPVEEFCALDAPSAATCMRRRELDRKEARFEPKMIETLARRARVVPRGAFADPIADTPELERVPAHAAVIDLRTEAEYTEWAWPGAIHMAFGHAITLVDRLPPDRAYLLYCEVGLKSAYLAQRMRETGFEAYSFRGGAGPMRAHAERVGATLETCA